MHENLFSHDDEGDKSPHFNGLMSRRNFLTVSTAMAGATFLPGSATVKAQPEPPLSLAAPTPGRAGLLYPQQNRHRNV